MHIYHFYIYDTVFQRSVNVTFRDALIIPFINCGTSIYAGFVIFAVLGYMANEKGVSVADVATEGIL